MSSSRGQGSPDERSRSDTPEIDYSVIRTAIKIGGKVIDQVLNGIHYGSAEVRNLLLEECDLILECKVCRNMFRGLPNLVAHKRVYCTETYKEFKSRENEEALMESEETVVVQPDAPNETVVDNNTSASQNKTSKSTVDKVVNRTFQGQSKTYNFYTKIAERMEAKKTQKPTSTVTLKTIPSNPNAKVMTITEKGLSEEASSNEQSALKGKETNKETCEEVGNEIDVEDSAGNVVGTKARTKPTISQLCDKLANSSAIAVSASEPQVSPTKLAYARSARLRNRKSSPRKSTDSFIGMKGQETERKTKTPSPAMGQKESVVASNDVEVDDDADFSADMKQFVADYALDKSWLVHCDLKSLTCRTCDKSFTTPYGLKFHCKMKHVDKLVQYPCPQCKKKFTYFTALARHLRAVHTKSERDIEFIQSKLKGKFGRRSSLESEDMETSDAEKSPEQLKKNMLALDTGWKKCDKCGKICWKAKSYYRHYQYCKGSADSSKSSSVETSPVKIRDKGTLKRINEKIKAVSTVKDDVVKEKHKFNEKLTIRTRKQAESQNETQNVKSPGAGGSEDVSKAAEKLVKSPGITITITEPHEIKDNQKPRALNFNEKKVTSKEISPIDIDKVRADRKTINKDHESLKVVQPSVISNPKASTEKTDQIDVNLIGKRNISTGKAVIAVENSEPHVKDSESKALHDALLSFNSSLNTEKEKQEIIKHRRGIDNQIEQASKQTSHDEARSADNEYVKPATRKTDQSLKESRRESTESHVRSLTISKILMKPVGRQNETEQKLNKEYIKPVTRGMDTTHNASISQNVNEQSSNQGKVVNRIDTSKQVSAATYDMTIKTQGSNKSDSKQVDAGLENNQSLSKEYTKPVTRRDDGTLPVKSDQKDVSKDSQPSQNFTTIKITKFVETKSVSKLLERQKEIQDMQNKDYVKPVTRKADGSLKDASKLDIQCKDNSSSEMNHAVPLEAYSKLKEKQAEFEQNASKNKPLQSDIDKKKQIDDDSTNESVEEKPINVLGQLKSISVKIPGSPSNKDSESVRSSLDSPTWTDNPMSKFKMTVKEMAELVESASLTKFARERKKKAKQILNKKQNGSVKTVKKKFKKKKPAPVVKKVYGTRLSTGTKSETAGSALLESDDKGHRYATRNMDIKTSGTEDNQEMGRRYETRHLDVKPVNQETEHKVRHATRTVNVKSKGEINLHKLHETTNETDSSNNQGVKLMKVDTTTKITAKDEIMIEPSIEDSEIASKVEEHATLNSKRKEFLAAKRDQRRKFLLANKTASPKKPSPEKQQPTRSRVLKDLPVSSKRSTNTAIKSLFPKVEKSAPAYEKTEHGDVETAEVRKLRLRDSESKISETKAINESMIGIQNSKEVEIVEMNKMDTHHNVSKVRRSRHSTSPKQTLSHELRSKSASLERGSRTFGQKSTFLERKRQSLPESSTQNSQRKLMIQRQLKKGMSMKGGRSKSSENIPISKLTLSSKTPKKSWELRHPRSESNQSNSEIAKTSEMHSESIKSNLRITNVNKAAIKQTEKEADKDRSDSTSKETKDTDTDSHPHKTRLSTGSLPVAIKGKSADSEMSTAQSSSTEDSSKDSATKLKKKRKRHLSAPQKKLETEPKEVKRFSLATGVIQCQRCGKAFWKKTSYTVHLMKSPCGKKQKSLKNNMADSLARKTDVQNQSGDDKISNKASVQPEASFKMNQGVDDQNKSSYSSTNGKDKVEESIKNSNHEEISDSGNKLERIESEGVRPRTKRPLSVSPKGVPKSSHPNEITGTVEVSKRPRLVETEMSNVESNLSSLAKENKVEKQAEIGKMVCEEGSENLKVDTEAVVGNEQTVRVNSAHNEMEQTVTKYLDEIPGTSKDFTDNDSDTGSEFSGFSEADLSYPTLPQDLSDYDSDMVYSDMDIKKSGSESVGNDYEVNEMKMNDGKEIEYKDEKNLMSVEEVWVGKEPGMPVTEKMKSNRIYVMDTESSRRLHCQDKRNIDSFVDEDSMKCLRCEREFSSISNLRQHVIRHLGWKRYQCKTCTVFSCYNLSEARMHLSRSHGLHVETDSDIPKYIKDLNKEAGKKRSTKRMKTIKKKKSIESPVGKRTSSSKAKNKVKQDESDLNTSIDTTITNINDNEDQEISSQNRSENSSSNESDNLSILKAHEYSKEPLHSKVKDTTTEGIEHTVTESNGVLHVEEVHGSVSPVKKSVRLAAKEDTRKSAVEMLKGPKLPPSPRKTIVSPPKSDGKKVNKSAAKNTDDGNTEDESPLVKARQMLAHVLNP